MSIKSYSSLRRMLAKSVVGLFVSQSDRVAYWGMFSVMLMTMLGTFALAGVIGDSEDVAGQLHAVSLSDKLKPIDVRVGDILQMEYDFAIIPQEDITNLDVEVDVRKGKDPLSEMGVVFIPLKSPDGEQVVGAGRIAAFMRADEVGKVKMIITPRTSPRGPFRLEVSVSEREEDN